MLRVNWQEKALDVRVYTALTGDMVKIGTTTTYPFQSGGTGGVPLNWNYYGENGAVQSDVTFTTAQGRCSIANALGANFVSGRRYGIYRDFTVVPGRAYVVRVQCRTTTGRSHTIRYVTFANPASTSWNYLSQVWSFDDDWEDVSLYTSNIGSNTLRVWLAAAPYTQIPTIGTTDQYWGIQFQNVAISETVITYPAPTWHEITCDVKHLTTHYGRDKFTERYNIATMTVKVDNSSGYYTYGNTNTKDDLRPGRLVKATLTLPDQTVKPLYFGVIDSFTDSYSVDGKAEVDIACVDNSSLLSNFTVSTMHSRADIVSSTSRFQNLCRSAEMNPSYFLVSDGAFSMQCIISNGRSVRDECALIGDSEGGWVFTGRDGVFTFRGRNWNLSIHNTVQAELIAKATRELPKVDDTPTVGNPAIVELRGLVTDWSTDRIVNLLSIANQAGSAFKYEDQDSQRLYGPKTYSRLDFLNDNAGEPTYADQRANDYMTGYNAPVLRVNSVTFRPDPQAFTWASQLFMEDLVRVRYQHPSTDWGWTVCTHVQGFTNTFTPTLWEMSCTLDKPESFVWYQATDGGWDIAKWDDGLWDEFGQEGAYWDSGEVWGN